MYQSDDFLFALDQRVQMLQRKLEREFFKNPRVTSWDYEESLRKIDAYKAIWEKRIAKTA